MWLVRNGLQHILHHRIFAIAAPTLTTSLPCLLWGVGCGSQLLGPLAKIGGVDPIPLRVGEQRSREQKLPLAMQQQSEHTNAEDPAPHMDITGNRILAGVIWAVATATAHRI